MKDGIYDGGLENKFALKYNELLRVNASDPKYLDQFLESARIMGELGNVVEGIKMLREVEDLYKQQGDYRLLSLVYYELGCSYMETEDYDASYSFFHKASRVFNTIGMREMYLDSLYKLFKLASAQGNHDVAYSHLQEYERLVQEVDE